MLKMNTSEITSLKNEKHYDEIYKNVKIDHILKKINNLNEFLNDVTQIDTSWVALYYDNFQYKIKGERILELGCGDCTNAAVMAALGAKVYANDISQYSGKIIDLLNKNFHFDYPIEFIKGDFLKSKLYPDFYDIVIGKAFVHHLTPDQEIKFIKKIVFVLKENGITRFFEPAVNSKLLDQLRWLIPVPGRPSFIQRQKFKKWKKNDPHPVRDNSSNHFKEMGEQYFKKINIIPFGAIERFHRILPKKYSRKFRKQAFKFEKYLPLKMNLLLTRSHLIEYVSPKNKSLFTKN